MTLWGSSPASSRYTLLDACVGERLRCALNDCRLFIVCTFMQILSHEKEAKNTIILE